MASSDLYKDNQKVPRGLTSHMFGNAESVFPGHNVTVSLHQE